MVQPEGFDDLWVVSQSRHMQRGGAFVVQRVGVCPTIEKPLQGFMTTHECKQVEHSACGHVLVLEKER